MTGYFRAFRVMLRPRIQQFVEITKMLGTYRRKSSHREFINTRKLPTANSLIRENYPPPIH